MTFEDNLDGWRDLARERLADWKAERKRRIKAEKERDTMRDGWNYTSNELAELRATLTPDAITDEMVERAAHCMAMQQMPTTYSLEPDGTADKFYDDAREVLHAALTEPPARPEGAEELAALIARAFNECDEWDDHDQLADYLAPRLLDPTVKDVN